MSAFTAVVNPAAGRGAGARVAAELVAAMPHGSVEVVAGRDGAHAGELAAAAAAAGRTVLAVGGDGHTGAVAGAVAAAGGLLGIVPVGRGNDFARQLGLPSAVPAVAEVLRGGRERVVDVIDAAGRTVLGSVYTGVDSAASEIVAARPRVPAGAVYRYAAVRALLTTRPAGFRLTLDGVEWAARGWSVVVANSGWYGAGMHIVPSAEVDDGLLDVLMIRDSSRWALIAALREVYDGSHIARPDIEVRRARTVEIVVDRPLPVHADGEPLASGSVTVSVRPAVLRVLA
ncbi:diacylglycerol kinase family protein [Pseudonocardia sp. N23]|uniref:diacylglycerol/lipid kinase family protein n=1 Tax=Pseudonocardia sp. N23 TaxID=1987376 RepID=UPI000BFBFEA2|nr:diacylglycerol kinase family protein [Pseudonocardia sp. N23]